MRIFTVKTCVRVEMLQNSSVGRTAGYRFAVWSPVRVRVLPQYFYGFAFL